MGKKKPPIDIPDLRHDHQEFTLDHCTVLQLRLARMLGAAYGKDVEEIADQCNPEWMRDELLTLMSATQLSLLFDQEFGKGLLVGIFFARFVMEVTVIEEMEEEY